MNGTIGTKLRSNWPIILALILAACMTIATIINGIIYYNSINNDSTIIIHYKKPSLINTFSEDAIKSWKSIGDHKHHQLTTNNSNNISKKILYWNFNNHEKYIYINRSNLFLYKLECQLFGFLKKERSE